MPLRFGAALRLERCFLVGQLTRASLLQRARIGFRTRLCCSFGRSISRDSRLSVFSQGRFGCDALVGGLKRFLFFGLTRLGGMFCNLFGVAARLSFFVGTRFRLTTLQRFGGESGFRFRTFARDKGMLAFGVGPRALSRRGFCFHALPVLQRLDCTGFVVGALARNPLRFTLRAGALARDLRGMVVGRDSLLGRRVGALFGLQKCLRRFLGFGFRSGARFGLRHQREFCSLAVLRSRTRLRIGGGACLGRFRGFVLRLQAERCTLLELALGARPRPRRFESFLFGGAARPCRFFGTHFRCHTGSCDLLGGPFSVETRIGLALELGLRLRTLLLGFERFLLRNGPRSCGFGGACFDRGALLRERVGTPFGFPARDRLLLRVAFHSEPRVCRLYRLLVDRRARVRRRHGFGFCLASCVRFFDCTRIRRYATLRSHLGLTFHFGTLQRYARGITVGFGACRRLGGAGRLCGLSCASSHERPAFGFGRRAFPRRFGRFGDRFSGRIGGRGDDIGDLLDRLSGPLVHCFVLGSAELLAAAGDFAPRKLCTAYVL
jgi:hypothetical protein